MSLGIVASYLHVILALSVGLSLIECQKNVKMITGFGAVYFLSYPLQCPVFCLIMGQTDLPMHKYKYRQTYITGYKSQSRMNK